MLHSWFGWVLAHLGCVLCQWGTALQERYYRYLPERDFERYLSAQLDQIITKAEHYHDPAQSGWSVLPD